MLLIPSKSRLFLLDDWCISKTSHFYFLRIFMRSLWSLEIKAVIEINNLQHTSLSLKKILLNLKEKKSGGAENPTRKKESFLKHSQNVKEILLLYLCNCTIRAKVSNWFSKVFYWLSKAGDPKSPGFIFTFLKCSRIMSLHSLIGEAGWKKALGWVNNCCSRFSNSPNYSH